MVRVLGTLLVGLPLATCFMPSYQRVSCVRVLLLTDCLRSFFILEIRFNVKAEQNN
jgi:hypothetical protein